VVFGYVPLGIAFGILFTDLGYHWSFASLMAVAVYAGSAQFLAIGLLAAGAGLLEIGVTTLILNSRHAFFGLSLLEKFRRTGAAKPYLVFALTDETYALLSTVPPPAKSESRAFYVLVSALNHAAWVLGCTAGGVAGQALGFNTEGMDFALTALFTVLVIEQYESIRTVRPFALAAAVGLATLAFVGKGNMLLLSIGASLLILLALGKRRGWA
jgi:4-azaleucine resistance transporter AzlC